MHRILLVEDDAILREMICAFLRADGHEVTTAIHGKEALYHALRAEFDLVITDIVMPEQEVLETIMALRKHRPGLKIIAMSSGGRNRPEDYLGSPPAWVPQHRDGFFNRNVEYPKFSGGCEVANGTSLDLIQ